MKSFLKLSILSLFIGLMVTPGRSAFATGEIKGIVLDSDSSEPLPGANVIVVGTQMGAASGPDGRFVVQALPAGTYTLEASIIGYERKRIESLILEDGASIEVRFELSEEPIPLSEVIVTPGHFSMMARDPTARQALKRKDIRSFPQFGEDIYRAVTRLPGLSGNDFSSRFTVRGGEQDEVLVLLDGLEIYDPFHLKDLTGAVSVIDVEAIGSIDMVTGAFPAEYGDRLSGVFNIQTANPSIGRRRTSVALSFMNARFLSEGGFADGRGQWLVLARRGYIDVLLSLIGEDDNLSPVYYDVLGKVQYQLHKNHSLAVNFLQAQDDLEVTEDEDTAVTSYGNTYAWTTWRATLHPKLFTESILSVGRITSNRVGTDLGGTTDLIVDDVTDDRSFDFYGLKQDWTYDLSDRFQLKLGADFKQLSASYDYLSLDRISLETIDGQFVARFDTTDTDLDPSGTDFGVYVSNRFRIVKPLTAEIGLRFDRASWTNDDKVSPRFNLAFAASARTAIRIGWGRFYQSQGIHQLEIQDNDDIFYPAELAEHRVVGLEHTFRSGVNFRIEAYQKKLSDVRPKFQNLSNELEFFPEVQSDRVRLEPEEAESKGIEFFIKKDSGGKFHWWGSYGYAFAEDKIDGVWVPRNFDQRHTLYLDVSFRPNRNWSLNLTFQYHSGWPYTPSSIDFVETPDGGRNFFDVYGPLNSARFPAYHRMDFRVSRHFDVGRGGFAFFFEVRNLYNRDNIRLIENRLRFFRGGSFQVVQDEEHWLPILPSIGLSYDF